MERQATWYFLSQKSPKEPISLVRKGPDWDAWLTFGLTLLISLLSLGIAIGSILPSRAYSSIP